MKSWKAPANSSRYFDSITQAETQQIGSIKVEIEPNSGYLRNVEYNPLLINYDSNYTTVNQFHLSSSTKEFEKLRPILGGILIVDIGCGQGEFVEFVRQQGEKAVGFDPVCRNDNKYLHSEIFDPRTGKLPISDSAMVVFVMRCVLPHIVEPWIYLSNIFKRWPNARILLQHQRLEYFHKTSSWNSLMHDHVNLFTLEDFSSRYEVENCTVFGGGEWQQILVSNKSEEKISINKTKIQMIDDLENIREKHIDLLSREDHIYIFGAAGKGINFAYAAAQSGTPLKGAIDDLSSLTGKFLECSGVEVLSSDYKKLPHLDDSILLVMNHNHLELARDRFQGFGRVESLATFHGKKHTDAELSL